MSNQQHGNISNRQSTNNQPTINQQSINNQLTINQQSINNAGIYEALTNINQWRPKELN